MVLDWRTFCHLNLCPRTCWRPHFAALRLVAHRNAAYRVQAMQSTLVERMLWPSLGATDVPHCSTNQIRNFPLPPHDVVECVLAQRKPPEVRMCRLARLKRG